MSAAIALPSTDELLHSVFERMKKEGQSSRDFGELGRLACVFHLDYALFDQLLGQGERFVLSKEFHETVFPFDVFEIALDGVPRKPFVNDPLSTYRPLRYILALRGNHERMEFMIADESEIIGKDRRMEKKVSAVSYTMIFARDPTSDVGVKYHAIRPKEMPMNLFDEKKMVQDERQHSYWLRTLCSVVRFCQVMNH